MRIILLKDVRKVGRKDDVKDVADGYAINFLLPQGLAVAASPEKVAALEKQHAEISAARAKEDAALDASVRSLRDVHIAVPARATPKGGLFKSITAADIAKAISSSGAAVPADRIMLPAPLKSTGEHRVTLRSANASSEIIVSITPAV